MLKLLLLGGLAVAVAGFVFAMTTFESSCSYGSLDSRPGSAAVSCKPRPAPTAQQRAAVRSGAAAQAGLAAFRGTEDAGEALIGFGLNAWGETTISIPVAADGFFATKQRFRHFRPSGKPAPTANETQHGYVMVNGAKAETFALDVVRPAALRRAIKRIEGRDRRLRFQLAELSGSARFGAGLGWKLQFTGASIAIAQMEPDGRGLCALNGIRDLRACPIGGGGAAVAPAQPVSGGAPGGDLAACVAKAGTDAAALAACAAKAG